MMGFLTSGSTNTREDHVAAAIRGNIRDERIREVLIGSEDIRAAAVAQAARVLVLTEDSLALLDDASEEARIALKTLAAAAAQSRADLALSAREVLVVVELAASAARQLVADEAKVVVDGRLGDEHANMMARLKTIDEELHQDQPT